MVDFTTEDIADPGLFLFGFGCMLAIEAVIPELALSVGVTRFSSHSFCLLTLLG